MSLARACPGVAESPSAGKSRTPMSGLLRRLRTPSAAMSRPFDPQCPLSSPRLAIRCRCARRTTRSIRLRSMPFAMACIASASPCQYCCARSRSATGGDLRYPVTPYRSPVVQPRQKPLLSAARANRPCYEGSGPIHDVATRRRQLRRSR